MPERIQRKRTAGWRMPEGSIYVGRPTKWGNPYVAGPGRPLLAGHDLVCWCPLDQPCHADVLLEIANA
ncbi:DUF4326 domain-containing protein [Mycobacteroides abscessus]|uniref:DUF4326 domain-containing protein n=1 Tax=Mycobacteroides abscessus TaxID=36809 RepID=UPI0019CFD268|nr:DUF4326 domain-containing protein [Mycobacteroides abscessus]MBN7571273.1 DUF4326 domain-containing protein [Mycobacteroides abscessus subsp. abscessus]